MWIKLEGVFPEDNEVLDVNAARQVRRAAPNGVDTPPSMGQGTAPDGGYRSFEVQRQVFQLELLKAQIDLTAAQRVHELAVVEEKQVQIQILRRQMGGV